MTNDNLISSLRNMVDDIENLGAAPLTVDVNVLRQAIVHLGMIETQLNTIKLQGDLMTAMGSEMRAAGCVYDQEACKVVNTLAPPEGFVMVPVEPTEEMRRRGAVHVSNPCGLASDVWAAMLAARPEVHNDK